ncbi:MAG TPA: aldehyde dehydrogenase family protein, partial [Polyangiaceae bacterium]|nr:aldehyde dehydrogenase family protein [Polyangiaceae bacterium]
MAEARELTELPAGTQLVVGGNRVVTVGPELASAFRRGDSLVAVERTGELLHIPAKEIEVARAAVTRAVEAFAIMSEVTDAQLRAFFVGFAERLADADVWSDILAVNAADVRDAKARGRSTTRLEATEATRQAMIAGLRGWAELDSVRGRVLETVDHGGWKAELVGAQLGVIAFVFEGRPNVVADATGVLRGGNCVVFRIGRDALNTAKAIIERATAPALRAAGLPEGAVTVVDSTAHAAGWALFRERRLSLAVARGSGPAVDTLGSLAQSVGVPVSLHGTGGAWLAVDRDVSPQQLSQNVFDSLDRKVCNTMNTCCLLRSQAERLVPAFLEGLERAAARRGHPYKLH